MEGVSENEKMSLVERKRQEAFASVLAELEARFQTSMSASFETGGREYELTSAEDCMVAYAQHMRSQVKALYEEIVAKNDYREEQAVAKLLELFTTYDRLIALYTELRSYYPSAAQRIEAHVPSLTQIAVHGEVLWKEVQSKKQ